MSRPPRSSSSLHLVHKPCLPQLLLPSPSSLLLGYYAPRLLLSLINCVFLPLAQPRHHISSLAIRAYTAPSHSSILLAFFSPSCDAPLFAIHQRLIYSGKVLKDEQTLDSYSVQEGHTVHMVTKPTLHLAPLLFAQSRPKLPPPPQTLHKHAHSF